MSDIHHEIQTNATRAAITEALTTQAGLQAWWATQTDLDGDAVTMTFDKEGRTVVMKFRVDEVVPGERIRWTCTDNGNPVWPGTTLTWTLDGPTIRFTHAGFKETASVPYSMTVEGWRHFCTSLQAHLDAGSGAPW